MLQVAGVLLIQDEYYVLQHRDNKANIAEPGMYSLWGGTMEHGEFPEDGARRELLEETGITIQTSDMRFLGHFETIGKGPSSFGLPVEVFLYCVALPSTTKVDVREGKGVYRHKSYSGLHENMNELAKTAIEIYETAAR